MGTNHVTYYGTADTVLSIIANAMLVALYLSPLPTILRMIDKQSAEEFHPYSYIMIFANCGVWRYYHIQIGQPPTTPFYAHCLSISNNIGLVLSMFYIFFFQPLATDRKLVIMSIFAFLVFVLFGATVFIVTIVQDKLIGMVCVVCGIAMYASPLSIIRHVYNTKSVEYLPFWTCMACFLNGVVWVIYICVSPTFDIYIAIMNGVGTLLGLFQLLVYYKFHSTSSVHPEVIEVV